jgi:TPR repeat protein
MEPNYEVVKCDYGKLSNQGLDAMCAASDSDGAISRAEALFEKAQRMRVNSHGTQFDMQGAFALLQESAALGHPLAHATLLLNEQSEESAQRAERLVRPLTEGDMTHRSALYLLARIQLARGEEEAATKNFRAASELGDADSLFQLSHTLGDTEEVIQCLEKAVELNHAFAMNSLAALHLSGRLPASNVDYAIELLKRGAALNNIDCLHNLGNCYRNGIGIDVDATLAFHSYTAAAAGGSAAAVLELARCFEEGFGAAKDPQRAFALYSMAAESGVSAALFKLHRIYEQGWPEIAEADPHQSMEFLIRAARAGSPIAQVALAECFVDGVGVVEDHEQAERLLRSCAFSAPADVLYRAALALVKLEKFDIAVAYLKVRCVSRVVR